MFYYIFGIVIGILLLGRSLLTFKRNKILFHGFRYRYFIFDCFGRRFFRSEVVGVYSDAFPAGFGNRVPFNRFNNKIQESIRSK